MKYSQKGNFLAVGSHDNKIYVYRRKGLREVNTEQKAQIKTPKRDYRSRRRSLRTYCVCAKHSSYITTSDLAKAKKLSREAVSGKQKKR